MKKIFIVLLVTLISLSIVSSVLAIDLGAGHAKNAALQAGYSGGTNETTLAETVGTIIKLALSLVGAIFLALMVYAGYLWMTAMGEAEKVEKGQTIIKQAIIGLIITVGAYSITSLIVPKVLERTTGSTGPTAGGPPGGCCMKCQKNNPTNCTPSSVAEQLACENLCVNDKATFTCEYNEGECSSETKVSCCRVTCNGAVGCSAGAFPSLTAEACSARAGTYGTSEVTYELPTDCL